MKKYRTPEHPFIVERLLGGLDNWDAEYFIFNAHSGYDKHEQTMAFFPLLPLGIRALSNSVFYPLGLVLPKRSVALISGVFLNLLLFPLATVILYLLTHKISANNKKVALLAAILFSLNPASVFMSAVYSETPFALLTFLGLLTLEEGKTWLSSLIFALASFTRSNGIVLCGFLGYQCLVSLFKTTWSRSSIHQKLWILSLSLISTAVQCATVLAPFYAFQHYGYMLYCQDGSTLPSSSAPSWCNRTVPIPYSYIQERYWNVGFLRYYELKQLPNFLLATPMVLLGVFGLACYFTGRYFGPSVRTGKNGRAEREGRTQSVRMTFLDDHRLRPYAFHLLFLLAFGICNMHIQVGVYLYYLLYPYPIILCLQCLTLILLSCLHPYPITQVTQCKIKE